MSTIQLLRAFVNQRLTVAVEEIIGMFERTITEYEEEIDRHRRLLDTNTFNHPTGESQDTQPLTINAKLPPEWQELSPSLHQEASKTPSIKEEPEEVWTSQMEELSQGVEFQGPPISMKSEDDEENAQSSQFHQNTMEESPQADRLTSFHAQQIKAGAIGGNCGELEPAFDLDVAGFLKATSDGQFFLSQCFKTDVLVDDWNQMIDSQPSLKTLKNNQAVSHKRSHKCQTCSKTFNHNAALQRHVTCHTREKPFDCTECGKTFRQKGSLHIHMRKHTGEKPFNCLVCGKNFTQSGTLVSHMRIHTGERPFCCSVCKKRYNERGTLVRHMRVHTGEKPFSCSLCGKRFSEKGNLNKHKRIHTGEKPFSCSECEKKFGLLSHLKNHKCSGKKCSDAVELTLQQTCPKVTIQLTRYSI
ncbi:zinc finger protein 69 homolog [Mastacembelus armatus]|uniref:zinc finger protein 69 homolog n=1 Tax=Mastacembelus armatus TaxID=205130 RepID=UPI000E463D1E|nr:zinc finger protein 69 homolog [Mastacembelus armatus]